MMRRYRRFRAGSNRRSFRILSNRTASVAMAAALFRNSRPAPALGVAICVLAVAAQAGPATHGQAAATTIAGIGKRAPITVEVLPSTPIIPPFAPRKPVGEAPPPNPALPLDTEIETNRAGNG